MKNIYLQRMGITSWQHRHQSAADGQMLAPSYFFCTLQTAQGDVVGAIAADLDIDGLSRQQALLEKIAQSIAPNIDVRTMCADEISALKFNDIQFLVLLGEQVPAILNFTRHDLKLIQSVSLAALEKDSAHKKSLWVQLKPLAI